MSRVGLAHDRKNDTLSILTEKKEEKMSAYRCRDLNTCWNENEINPF